MKKLILGIVIGVLAGAVAAHWWWHPTAQAAGEKPEAPAAKADDKPQENPLHINAQRQQSAGIKLGTAQSMPLPPVIQAFGRVLDPTPYVTLVAEEATARAALSASEKELERSQKLFAAGGNASAQSVETAEAAAVRDRAAVASAHIRLLAGWGAALASHANLDELRDTLAKGAALVRIDLLPGEMPSVPPKTARVKLLGGAEEREVEILGPAPVADPQVQGVSYLALLRGTSLPAGASLEAEVAGRGDAKPALIVPQSAVVYHEGSAWVYTFDQENFQRKRVVLGRTVDDNVVIVRGVDADDRIALTGAAQLLSAELTAGGSPDQR